MDRRAGCLGVSLSNRREQLERELGDLSRFVRFRLEGEGDELEVCVPGCGPGGVDRRIPIQALLSMRRRLTRALAPIADDSPATGRDGGLAWDETAKSGRASSEGVT